MSFNHMWCRHRILGNLNAPEMIFICTIVFALSCCNTANFPAVRLIKDYLILSSVVVPIYKQIVLYHYVVCIWSLRRLLNPNSPEIYKVS